MESSLQFAEVLFLIGRILFGGYFAYSGINHFIKWDMMRGFTASKGVPQAGPMVAISGILLLVGGLGIVAGVAIPWAVASLAVFLIPTSLLMHAFWKDTDPMQKMANQINFMKNMALLGAALMLLMIPMPWAIALS
ncbi:MAG: DoxX family protein [Candidatus Vogelbacteria bacterium CG10_big_fil_rev_8_21_14_0_10_45_14]|uniref:DoxX family protein n=1 Tax=Candidatus Vogelbacteria bacterium CG10_big_fil_rev_8_21_14_0_10_45_14 TaxID=1975042 RepID=A0A2H0RMN0_9BACT|nr:MAG: DoxX family protein [Candidatus Vogelbacteria bacterium CG10_big_fil_rev_8_21_14_0_10_45_14]